MLPTFAKVEETKGRNPSSLLDYFHYAHKQRISVCTYTDCYTKDRHTVGKSLPDFNVPFRRPATPQTLSLFLHSRFSSATAKFGSRLPVLLFLSRLRSFSWLDNRSPVLQPTLYFNVILRRLKWSCTRWIYLWAAGGIKVPSPGRLNEKFRWPKLKGSRLHLHTSRAQQP